MSTINSKDISVVVQGVIDKKFTALCLNSIRQYLPEAEIILSTWKDSDISNLNYDYLVLSTDPGAEATTDSGILNNINRQIVTSKNGIALASRQYTLKIRSDMELTGTGFLNFYHRFPKRKRRYAIFKKRIVVAALFSRIYSELNGAQTPFHPSDWYLFGHTEDIQAYFDVPLTGSHYTYYRLKYPDKRPYPDYNWQYSPEQYLCVSFFKKFFKFKFDDCTDWNDKNQRLSMKIIANNFIILEEDKSRIRNNKYGIYSEEFPGITSFGIFKRMYKEYCYINSVSIKKCLSSIMRHPHQ